MNTHFAFIDESGVLDESVRVQPYFAVGLLRIADTSLLTEKLLQRHYDYFSVQKEKRKAILRELKEHPRILSQHDLNQLFVSTRHHEYKFTHITYTTLERYKSFLDTAFESPLYFCALVIDKTDPLFDSTIYRNYWEAYIKYSKLLCQNNCKEDEKLCVIADYMNRPSDSSVYFEGELNTLPMVENSLRAHSETFPFLQVCDLLLGSVLFQWRKKSGFVKASNRAKAKEEFVHHLVDKLSIPESKKADWPLAQAITCNAPVYFSVWPLKLMDTKSGGV